MPTKKKRVLTVVPTAFAPTQALPAKQKNHFIIVLDRSGSMHSLSARAVQAVNSIVTAIKNGAATFNQETTISLYTFSTDVQAVYRRTPAEQAQPMRHMYCGGGTALFDAVGSSVESFQKDADAKDSNTSYVVIAVTDGGDNASRMYRPTDDRFYPPPLLGARKFVDVLKELVATDRYTVTFQLPPGYGNNFVATYGIQPGNVREWEQTEAGVQELVATVERGTQAFFNSRSVGLKSVDNFYVQTDLSNLKKSDLKKLVDVQARFKAWTVEKEADVKTFVEDHGKKFVIGATFYALTKKEKVQPQKAVLIQEKGTKAVYAGQEARDLIGLPKGINATVEPGNHANYDIYVQSTSVNRKLVRGTKVLFDTSLSVDLTPTWDHIGAKAAADAKKGVTF
jgi:hypothetical protein